MRQVAILALVLAVLFPGSLTAQARGQQEIGPILRERGQAEQPVSVGDQGPTQSADQTRQ